MWLFAADTYPQEEKEDEIDTIDVQETVQAVAWLDTMSEESGLIRVNEAAITIQVKKRDTVIRLTL